MNNFEIFEKLPDYKGFKFVWAKITDLAGKEQYSCLTPRGGYTIKWHKTKKAYCLYYKINFVAAGKTISGLKERARKHYNNDAD